MFSLFARLGVVARPAAASLGARRTFFATPRFNIPAHQPAAATVKKDGRRKVAKPAKRGRPPKKQAAKDKEEKQRVRIPRELRPPKRAPGPYFLFYSSFLKSQPRASTLEECQDFARRASEIWRGYSMAEKQPFYDENEARKVQAKEALDEYFDKTSVSDLKKLNKIRKSQGRNKVHSTKKSTRPIAPFILFANEFRNSPEAQELISGMPPQEKYTVRFAVAAGARWKSMTKAEKAPYIERFEKIREALKAEKAEQAQS